MSVVASVLGAPVQIAYAVNDLDLAATEWRRHFGAGPFFISEHIALSEVRYRGAPGSFDHSSAYGQWGEVMVELVKDHTVGPSAVADVVGPGGSGLHHLAYFVDDFASAQSALIGAGWPEVLWAVTPSGVAFAFHDASATLGHMVEIYQGIPALTGFYAMVRDAAQGWDGSDPIRRRRQGSAT